MKLATMDASRAIEENGEGSDEVALLLARAKVYNDEHEVNIMRTKRVNDLDGGTRSLSNTCAHGAGHKEEAHLPQRAKHEAAGVSEAADGRCTGERAAGVS